MHDQLPRLHDPHRALLAIAALAIALLVPAAVPAHASPAPEPEIGGAALAPTGPGLAGRVTGDESPLGAVRVYVFQLADSTLLKGDTDERGRFWFEDLPAGLYKVVAHKGGFLPAVAMLTRTRPEALQTLELQLTSMEEAAERGTDFWSVRDQIPPDVLREITPTDEAIRTAVGDLRTTGTAADEFGGSVGIEQLPGGGEAMVSGNQIGIEGRVGDVQLALAGDYWKLGLPGDDPASQLHSSAGFGERHHISLALENGNRSRFDLETSSQHLALDRAPMSHDSWRMRWSQGFGDGDQATFAARQVTQTNYYGRGGLDPLELPEQSETWSVESTYHREIDDRRSFQTGVRYRERQLDALEPRPASTPSLAAESLDLFGRAGWRVQPTVLVEYGLFTTLRDGSLSLIPQGGLVVQLDDEWQASALASHRLPMDEEVGPRDFLPMAHGEDTPCSQGEASCYRLAVSREGENGEGMSLQAVHREIGDTLQLIFRNDGFGPMESLYLVRGDRVPEMSFGVSRRLAPRVLARLSSNVGSGGGGVFYATDQELYENSVRYLVTSLDTEFEGSATGVFVSFHHLEQDLSPLAEASELAGDEERSLELQRLQLMLTQDLNLLVDLAADWALRLDMEVSRGSTLFVDDHELRKKILGGVAVRF